MQYCCAVVNHAAITKPSVAEINAAGQKVIDEALEIAAEMNCEGVKIHMPQGDAVTEILVYADKIGADLIVQDDAA
jgi:nucleotide-binding universal stress UspA family protein